MTKFAKNIVSRRELATATGVSLIGILPSGAGAVQTTVEAGLRRAFVTPENFGAVCDGITNDYNALVKAEVVAAAAGIPLRLTKMNTGVYFLGTSEWVVSSNGFVLECDAGVEVRGKGGVDGGFVVSFAKQGGTAQPSGLHPTNQRVTGLRVRTVAPFSVDRGRAAIRVCGSYSKFTDCSATTTIDNGGNGWTLEADDTGSGPYYNTFIDCNLQGPQNGRATGTGVMMRQKSTTVIATRYPNTNTFIGGRVGGYAVNIELTGTGNKFIGVAAENTAGFGTAFKWVAPVASANVANAVIAPYIENSAIAFEVQTNASAPSVHQPYVTGSTAIISDPSNRLTFYGQDGVRDLRLAKAPNAYAARSGIYLGNTGNVDTETLDWYEEVTFTPKMMGSTSLASGTTHAIQVGCATRIGNRVIFSGTCSWTGSTETGNILIDLNEIAWACSAVSHTGTPVTLRVSSLAWSAGKQITGIMQTGTKRFQVEQLDTAGGAAASVPMDTAGNVVFSGEFMI